MKKKIGISILLIVIIFYSCSTVKEYNVDFVNKHGQENYEAFNNISIIFRGLDSNGNVIIFISRLDDSKDNGPYIVTIDKQSMKVISTDYKLMTDTINFDFPKFENLAIKFVEYNIYQLIVDKSGNISIKVINSESQTLSRLATSDELNQHNKKHLRKLDEHWYVLIND